jgi:uncharacterized protein (TIGR02145 family)
MKKIILNIFVITICNLVFSQTDSLKTNLNFENYVLSTNKYRNGDTLFYAQTIDQWNYANERAIGAYCYIDNDSSKGILYNWYAVYDKRNIAPVGWKIPTEKDFLNFSLKQKKLKYTKVKKSNFSGYRDFSNGEFNGFNDLEYYWTSTNDSNNIFNAKVFMVSKNDKDEFLLSERKEFGYSILVIQNHSDFESASINFYADEHLYRQNISDKSRWLVPSSQPGIDIYYLVCNKNGADNVEVRLLDDANARVWSQSFKREDIESGNKLHLSFPDNFIIKVNLNSLNSFNKDKYYRFEILSSDDEGNAYKNYLSPKLKFIECGL